MTTKEVSLGIFVQERHLPSESARRDFFERFGHQHCFITRSWWKKFKVFSARAPEKLSFETLPIDYLYAPDDWQQRLTDDQIRNVLLSLKYSPQDFLIVSASLSELPVIKVSSLGNHTIYAKRLGLDFLERQNSSPKNARIAHLLPYPHPVNELNVVQTFTGVTWAPLPCWPPRNAALKKNQYPGEKESVSAFIPPFKKQKPLVFVWPIIFAVGGAERNVIEVMTQLKDRYHFVVITMERLYQSQGSLHHQLENIAEAVYDLGELGDYESYFDMLSDLKQTYRPDFIWTTNGAPWFSDNALQIRELFNDVPIIDQQVYDTNRGWILRYREPGVQSFDRFVAINRKIQDTFIDRFKMDPDRIDLIYHAVDTERFDPALYSEDKRNACFKKFGLNEKQTIFVFAGRLTGQKRPLDFLELALRRQLAGDPAWFVMIGDGDLAPPVDDFIREHNVANVRRIPFVENMAEIFSLSSGLILTSEFEGMPIVILEALCMGVPVLATDVGDVKLMLDEYQAGLVISEVGDIDSLEQGYEKWTSELENYQTKARSNSAGVRQRFSGKSVAQQYAESWERARAIPIRETRKMTADPDLVSVIIPSYNHARYLREAIDSVLNQSYRKIELIVVDDGSSDDSLNILKQIDDHRFSYYRQENQGAHAAINRGLGLASADYLAILNSDDAFHPDRIKELMPEFHNDPDTEMLSTWIEVVDAEGKQLGIKEGWHNLEPWPIPHPELSFEQTDDFGLNSLRGNFVATTSNVLMRRRLYERIGGMRSLRFSHDWDFVLRAAAAGKCKLIPKPLLRYRVHGTNTISSDRAGMLLDICWVLAANLHRYEESRLFNKSDLKTSIDNLFMLYESINVQGNDKVLWALRAFIQSMRSQGVENPEDLLLEKDFKEKFIAYIQP